MSDLLVGDDQEQPELSSGSVEASGNAQLNQRALVDVDEATTTPQGLEPDVGDTAGDSVDASGTPSDSQPNSQLPWGPPTSPRRTHANTRPKSQFWLPLLAGALGAAIVGTVLLVVAKPKDTTRVTSQSGVDIQQVVRKVEPAVVAISTTGFRQDAFENVLPLEGAGTGVIIESDGLLLTNAHVVEGASQISVRFDNGDEKSGVVVGRSQKTDLALVQVGDVSGLATIEFADSSAIEVGDPVIAIGNALALPGGPTVTSGIISATARSIDSPAGLLEGLVQTDAAINPGNSGGPLIDAQGEIVGINTAVAGNAENLGFAISSDVLIREVKTMRGGDAVSPAAFLGVASEALTDQNRPQGVTTSQGVVITQVIPGSTADQAGVRVGDVVVSVAGHSVTSGDDVRAAVSSLKVGDEAEVVLYRGSEKMTIKAKLGARPI